MATDSICGDFVSSQRGLLAILWSLVNILTFLAFLIALIFAITAKNADYADSNDDNEQEEQNLYAEIAVTSRAMAFAALWTAVLATLMGLFGTVILGFQSPTGQYYTCCSSGVHRTTALGIGSFIGSLIMFANLTLVCSVLFGEFQIRDYQKREGDDGDQQNANNSAVEQSSMAFSIMCMFLTVVYAGFAALTFAFSSSVIEENNTDAQEEVHGTSRKLQNSMFTSGYIGEHSGYIGERSGYIGERFDVHPQGGFVSPPVTDGTLT